MSKDLTKIISGWDYDADEVQVRLVAGDDGRDKIQMRIDLGVLQMELDGRPDGTRPHGLESLLDYHEARAKLAETESDDTYSLDALDCTALMHEGVQFYHRYLAAFHLQRYDLVVRDTSRNLRLFAFAVKHAIRQRDKVQFDQYRPYVTMMRTRALGLQALALNQHAEALEAIDDGIAAVRRFLAEYDQADSEHECKELGFLLRWRKELEREQPVGIATRLEQQLALAVLVEDYEEAARVRDQILRLKGQEAVKNNSESTLSEGHEHP